MFEFKLNFLKIKIKILVCKFKMNQLRSFKNKWTANAFYQVKIKLGQTRCL